MPRIPSLMVARFMRLPRRSADIWQGGVVAMPMWVDRPDGTTYRPRGAVWVSLETGLANAKLGEEDAPDGALALDALLELGLRFAQTRPAGIEVANRQLGEEVARELGDAELGLRERSDLPQVAAMVATMAEDTSGAAPPALDARGVTVERMRAFAAAARDCHAAAPWRYLTDEDLIHVESPPVGKAFRHLTVLGNAGHTFGVAFYASPRDLDELTSSPDPAVFLDGDRWAVLFNAPWETPFADLDLWEQHRLPLAAPDAYPVAILHGASGRIRRPNARELSDIETILRALARTTEPEVDQGRWSHDVEAPDGPRRVTLAIPALLRPVDAPPERGTRGMSDRRATERLLVEVQRFTATRQFGSEAELNAAVQAKFTGPIDAIPSTATSPVERAQDLVYRAFDARGRRRIQLARKALELSADCADAYVVLAEECGDPALARDLYVQGVAAGERTLGAAPFAQAGGFWGDVRRRPYMRARYGLARCLEDLDQPNEAIAHYRELLRLDEGDHQGARYDLLNALLFLGRQDEVESLLPQFADPSALWVYGAALSAFRREGNGPTSRQRLRDALRSNRHVPGYLTGASEWTGPSPDSYAMGSREEAVVCLEEQGDAWEATPGALEWLAAHSPKGKTRKRRR